MINSNVFGFQFFLGGKEKVSSLYEGAKKNNGATKYENEIISNIPTDEFIRTYNDNTISIFIPSTIDVDFEIDNAQYVRQAIKEIRKRYSLESISFYNTEGSWLDEQNNEVVIEKITIINLRLNKIDEQDIRYFVNIAEHIKSEMSQQAVSLNINDCLAIV